MESPSGVVHRRRSTPLRRRAAAALVGAGSPVIVQWPGGSPERTTVIWHDGDDALAVRGELRGRLTVDPPVPVGGEV